MTELKLNSKTEIAKDASKPDRRIWITAVFAGLLMVTVLLGLGSSKKTNKPVTFDPPNQNSSTQAPATASSAPSTTSGPGMPAEPVAKKKPVRKRPATVTYVDDKYGVSFHYPRKYALKASDQTKDQTKPESSGAEPLPMNFIESGGVHVVSVELPGSLYQGTDFVSGIFNVSVNKSLTSEQCGQFATSQKSENGPVSPLKVNFRGVEFSQLETTTDLTDTRY